jgi:hypothetical protein
MVEPIVEGRRHAGREAYDARPFGQPCAQSLDRGRIPRSRQDSDLETALPREVREARMPRARPVWIGREDAVDERDPVTSGLELGAKRAQGCVILELVGARVKVQEDDAPPEHQVDATSRAFLCKRGVLARAARSH